MRCSYTFYLGLLTYFLLSPKFFLMTSVPGTVEAVHMVSRITPEGSKLFSAYIIVENEGAQTADMVAYATATVSGETVYPYEAGKLVYYRTGDMVSTVDGTVISSNLVDYLQEPATPYFVTASTTGSSLSSVIFCSIFFLFSEIISFDLHCS